MKTRNVISSFQSVYELSQLYSCLLFVKLSVVRVQLKTINTRRTPRCHFNENKNMLFCCFIYSGTKVMECNWDRKVGVTDCSVLFVFF